MLKLEKSMLNLAAWTAKKTTIVQNYFSYLNKLLSGGKLILAGRTQVKNEKTFSIVIFEADNLEEAKSIAENDPVVKGNVLTVEVFSVFCCVRKREKKMISDVKPFADTLRINSALFINSFKGIDEKFLLKRPSKRTNNMIFLALHLVDARFFILNLLGIGVISPYAERYKDARGIEDIDEYPPLADLLDNWNRTGELILKELAILKTYRLRERTKIKFPNTEQNLASTLAFLLSHESYHIGQLAYIRKYLGFPPIEY